LNKKCAILFFCQNQKIIMHFYTKNLPSNKAKNVYFYLSTVASCLSFCFHQASFAQVRTPQTPTQNSIQSTTVTTDLTQVINHNSTESGSPVIQATGADITVNLASNSQLYAQGLPGDDFRALDITIEHTEASKNLGISPKLVINSSGTVQGIRINTIADFFETVATPVTVNITSGKVYGDTFAIFINQFRSDVNSPTTVNINNAEVYITTTDPHYSAIALYGSQMSPDLVNLNIGKNGSLNSKYGDAFTTIGNATITNRGFVHGNIRIDNVGKINNYGNWLVGGNNNETNDSTSTEIYNFGTMGLPSFDKASHVNYTGNIFNSAILKLSNGYAGDTVTINGNLNSSNASAISFDVNLSDDQSAKDLLIITGNTSGEGKLFIRNIGGSGAQTINGIQIIKVQGLSEAIFTLGQAVQAGNYEYFLHKLKNDYYLISNLTTKKVNPKKPVSPPITAIVLSPYVLRPAVTGFLMAPAVNFAANWSMLGNTYSRVKAKSNAKNSFQSIWAQAGFSNQNFKTNVQSNDNPNLNFTELKNQQDISFLQLGSELWSQSNVNTLSQQSLHLLAGVSQSNASFNDTDRALAGLNTQTSELVATEGNLGLEYQYSFESGMYVNSLASISQLRNSYTDVYGGKAKQNGKGFNVSLETGRPYQMAKWTLEPQAQIVFQQLHLDAFHDEISSVQSHRTHNTRLRTGVKLSQKNIWLKDSNFFTQLDLLQDHQANKYLNISYENINTKLINKPWLGLTVGGSYYTGQTQLKAQMGYERSLSGNGKNGFNVQLALNHLF
jgi:outer membrane autotransporter protein